MSTSSVRHFFPSPSQTICPCFSLPTQLCPLSGFWTLLCPPGPHHLGKSLLRHLTPFSSLSSQLLPVASFPCSRSRCPTASLFCHDLCSNQILPLVGFLFVTLVPHGYNVLCHSNLSGRLLEPPLSWSLFCDPFSFIPQTQRFY